MPPASFVHLWLGTEDSPLLSHYTVIHLEADGSFGHRAYGTVFAAELAPVLAAFDALVAALQVYPWRRGVAPACTKFLLLTGRAGSDCGASCQRYLPAALPRLSRGDGHVRTAPSMSDNLLTGGCVWSVTSSSRRGRSLTGCGVTSSTRSKSSTTLVGAP